jgi:hypothetical protein
MPYTLLQAKTPSALSDQLNGVLLGSWPLRTVRSDGPKGSNSEEVFLALNGLKLEFTTPVVTVTFASADPVTIADMLTELNTQVQAADVNFLATAVAANDAPGTLNPPHKRLRMVTTTPAGLVIDLAPASSTAAYPLGFPTGTLRTLSAAPVDSTKIVFGGDTISGGHYIILAP